ncbi:hypothetical protein chiPu_0024375, partial [Chiloscyllium punctatum]|nr:hypothetical protein [Chiloscyllium punctatum]
VLQLPGKPRCWQAGERGRVKTGPPLHPSVSDAEHPAQLRQECSQNSIDQGRSPHHSRPTERKKRKRRQGLPAIFSAGLLSELDQDGWGATMVLSTATPERDRDRRTDTGHLTRRL